MKQYFVHNGFSAGSGKLPADPQLISEQDADKLMQFAGLEPKHVGNLTPRRSLPKRGTGCSGFSPITVFFAMRIQHFSAMPAQGRRASLWL
ncbi:hypothetical protein ACWAU3_15160 [Shewanella sp. JL219SE-S6]